MLFGGCVVGELGVGLWWCWFGVVVGVFLGVLVDCSVGI